MIREIYEIQPDGSVVLVGTEELQEELISQEELIKQKEQQLLQIYDELQSLKEQL